MRSLFACTALALLAPLAQSQSFDRLTLIEVLQPSTPVASFGRDLETDEDGDRVAIAAAEQGFPVTWRIFIFERGPGGWTERAQIAAPVQATGHPDGLALWGDRLAVASEDRAGFGAVYLYEVDAGGNWNATAKLQESVASAGYGASVAMIDDTIFVGAPSDTSGVGTGSVVVFVEDSAQSNGWRMDGKLYSSVGEQSFGRSLDASMNRLAVAGSKQAHLFGRLASGAPSWGKLNAIGGWGWPFWSGDVAVHEDVAVVGDPEYMLDNLYADGAAHIHDEAAGGAGNWGEVRRVLPFGPAYDYGVSVDINGSHLAVLDPGSVKFGADIQVFKRVPQPGADAWAQVGVVSGNVINYFDDFSKVQLAGLDVLAGEPSFLYLYGGVYVYRMIDALSYP